MASTPFFCHISTSRHSRHKQRLEQAIVRYRAAVDMKNELDPDFVIMAQCYARNAPRATRCSTVSAAADSPR